MPNEIFTVAVLFSVDEHAPADQLWVAHFVKEEDAFKAFKLKVKECLSNSKCRIKTPTFEEFEDLLTHGNGYNAGGMTLGGLIFARRQPLYQAYSKKDVKWD